MAADPTGGARAETWDVESCGVESCDVAIIGAGAAGLMCAMAAGQRGRRVIVLDHADKAGEKILISGGGRCNFTNRDIAPDRFLSENPHFAHSALGRYTQHDFIALVDRHRIAWHEKTLGQLFCDGSARQIVAMLMAECEAAGVAVRLGRTVTGIARGERFRIEASGGPVEADRLVIATGGPSIPKMGATGFAYDVARQFGLRVTETRPALVPLTTAGPMLELCRSLAGTAVEAEVRCGRQAFREAVLFTHRGLSGPAILQISSYWREGEAIVLDLVPGRGSAPGRDLAAFLAERKRARPKAGLATVVGEILPHRLADRIAAGDLAAATGGGGVQGGAAAAAGPPIGTLADRRLAALAAEISAWRIVPAGSEGYAKAEVTLGGVDTAGLSQRTFEAKAVPGLHFIGEAVDVTGWLGGYNFQWAWSSGWCAGQAV